MPSPSADVLRRNAVRVTGNASGQAMIFAHGFGGTGEAWRFVAPEFEADYRIVVFDHVGAGGSDLSFYDRAKYDSLHGYVDDLVEIIEALELTDVILVGHSVSGIVGLLAANARPELFSRLILIGPSPRYLNDVDYTGGFSRDEIDQLLDSLDSNYLGWSTVIAPTLMGNSDRPELGAALAQTIQAIDPAIAAQFARVTFLSDNRRDLRDVTIPTLVLQSSEDMIAALPVGQYVHSQIPDSTLVVMSSRGHVPILSDPAEVTRHMKAYLA